MYPIRDGPFQVLERINDNAYKLDSPDEYNASVTFKVADFSLFDAGESLRSNPFKRDKIMWGKLARILCMF